MIKITDDLIIDEDEIQFEFLRASGPGGQKVNKTASAVHLRFDVANSSFLPDDVRERLLELAGKRVTEDGILIIEASRHRTQEQNRQDALERLVKLVREAAEEPKERIPTKPTRIANQKRLEDKKKHGEKKRQRKADEWDIT